MAVVYLVILTGCSLHTVVHILNIRQLELVSRGVLIGVGEVITCIKRTVELYVLLGQVLCL